MIKKYKAHIMVAAGASILILDLLGINGAVTFAIGIILITEGVSKLWVNKVKINAIWYERNE